MENERSSVICLKKETAEAAASVPSMPTAASGTAAALANIGNCHTTVVARLASNTSSSSSSSSAAASSLSFEQILAECIQFAETLERPCPYPEELEQRDTALVINKIHFLMLHHINSMSLTEKAKLFQALSTAQPKDPENARL